MNEAQKTVTIWFLEDEPADVELVRRELTRGGLRFTLEQMTSAAAFREGLRERHPDIILSDRGVPGLDGFAALEKARGKDPAIPFIFVTGSLGEEGAIRAFESGATDFVLKNRLRGLGPAVRRALAGVAKRGWRQDAEQWFKLLSQEAPGVAIYRLDAGGRVASWNAGAQRMHGFGAEEILGRNYACLFTPEAVAEDRPEQLLQQTRESGRVADEGWRVRKEGSRFAVDTELMAVRDSGGGLAGFAVLARHRPERAPLEDGAKAARDSAAVQAAPDAIVTLNEAGVVLDWNPAAERMFGYSPAEAVGKELAELIIPPLHRATHRRGLKRYLAGERRRLERRIEMAAQRADGGVFPAELAIVRLRGDGPPLFTGYMRDVTQRKEAEAALRSSEESYRRLVELSPTAVVLHLDDRIIFCNPAAARIAGATDPQQLIGRRIYDFIPADEVEELRARLSRVREGETVNFQERTILRLDGSRTRVESAATLVHLPGRSEQASVLSVALDLTERQRAAQALRESEERFRLALEELEDYGIYMLDLEGRVISWNAGAQRITGFSAEEILGESYTRFFTPEDCARGLPEEELRRASQTGVSRNERECVRKDGSVYLLAWVLTAVRDAAGQLTGYLRVTHDVTERRRAEQEIGRLTAELEARVAQRTRELQAANQELEAFSYSVSHDLRAPLRHIAGFVELLEHTAGSKLDASSQDYLRVITEAAGQMGKLIDALLSFSRTARLPLNKTEIELKELVGSVVHDLHYDLIGRKIEWVIGDLGQVQGDPDLLRQVLMNLFSNALKYTRGRELARIEVGSRRSDRETVVHVRDNGIGFDMKYADKLFGVFQRLHSASEFEGTGIGLANVRRIIQRHGGRVWAEAAVGSGATFYFALPND